MTTWTKELGLTHLEYVEQIDAIENQVTEFEAVVSMLDKYVSLLESKFLSDYQTESPSS